MTKNKNEELFVDTNSYWNSVYGSQWWIVFTNDIGGHLNKELKKQGATKGEIKFYAGHLKYTAARVNNIELKNGKNFNVVVFDINKYSPATGVHEAFHIVKDILYKRGLRVDESVSSEEAWAYMLGNVYESIYANHKISSMNYKNFKKEQALLKKQNNEKTQ